ncbi:hypothetical protein E2C01_093788 [Portunus trituberculatus]|uniref:Uncharacterized protein n=1 Tax=Portunus trituberculatus TaxID=210409 RepID=A0A5B7JZ31_PORTR|nr:hypothetical protein [Portunus trituberculatus]
MPGPSVPLSVAAWFTACSRFLVFATIIMNIIDPLIFHLFI